MRASGGDDGETIPSGAVALPFLWLLIRLRPSNAGYSDLYAVRSEAETGVEAEALWHPGSPGAGAVWEYSACQRRGTRGREPPLQE